MNTHNQRAILLFEQSRYELAEQELRRSLGEDADDFFAHALLALCLAERERFDEATHEARHAIHLAPDNAFAYYVLARVMIYRNQDAQALAAVEEAIRLDPHDERYYGCLAQIHYRQRRWQPMLEAAREGLAIDPDDDTCANLQAMALTKLGRPADADATIQRALERNPDDAYTHANRGWTLLEQGDHAAALDHFREALRLDPTIDWARQGIVEALKARYFIYRLMLKFFFWMSRLPSGAQWGIIIGGLVGQRVLSNLANNNPSLQPFVWPILGVYIAFVLMTWLASPLFNLLLRLNRYGRLALSREQVITSNWVGSLLLCAAACGILALACFLNGWPQYAVSAGLLALVSVLVLLPLSSIHACDIGWPRTTMILITAVLAAIGIGSGATVFLSTILQEGQGGLFGAISLLLRPVLFFAAIGSQLAANFLVAARVRR